MTKISYSSIASLALFAALASAGPAVAQELDCAAGTRAFASTVLLKGPICVPEAPEAIAFIDDSVVYALELGIPTITTSYYSDIIAADFPGLAPLMDPATTTDVGNTWEMSGEPLLVADPDVVVTYKYWEAAIGFAEDVAPTLIIDDDKATSWRDLAACTSFVGNTGSAPRPFQLTASSTTSIAPCWIRTRPRSRPTLWPGLMTDRPSRERQTGSLAATGCHTRCGPVLARAW